MNTDPSFEREKWEADVRLRERELDIKAAEQAAQASEIQARIREQERSRLFNPLVLAVLAAALAASGNAVVAWVNGSAQRDLEDKKSEALLKLERYKAETDISLEKNRLIGEQSIEETKGESARILEMIRTADPDKAAVNLAFLLDAGLIANDQRKVALLSFLSKRRPGEGPTLPTGGASSRSIVMGPLFSDLHCRMKGGQTKQQFISLLMEDISNYKYGIIMTNQADHAEYDSDDAVFWVQRLDEHLRFELHFNSTDGTVSANVAQYSGASVGDDTVLANPGNFDLREIVPPLLRAAFRKLVIDPSCVRNPSSAFPETK